jgi:hypothetical protein
LTFADLTVSSYSFYGPMIDNVQIIPEPASLMLLSVAAGLVLLLRRRSG